MGKMVTVQRMPHTITFEGKNYGPSSTPLQVPEELAAALGLPVTTAQAAQTAQQQNATQEIQASRALAGQYQERFEKLQSLLQTEMSTGETPETALQRVLNFIKESERIFTPVAGDNGKSEDGLEAMQRIVNERNSLKSQVANLTYELNQAQGVGQALEKRLTEAEEANLEYLEYVGELLPQGFPERKLLMTEGYITLRHVQEADDAELKDIDGIADKRLEAIRKVAPYTPAEEPLTDDTPGTE